MPRNITVTFSDGSTHVYQNAPDNITPDQVTARAQKDFGKPVKALDGGRNAPAPRAAAPRQAPRPSMATNALNSLAAVGGALWRGPAAVPDMAADIGDAVTGGINALAQGRMPWEIDQNAPQRPKFRLSDVPDRLGTPRPVSPGVEFAGNVLGGALIPGPKIATQSRIRAPVPVKPTSAAGQVVKDAAQAGVRVMTSDVKPPKTFAGKSAQAVGERIPFAGTGAARMAQQEQRVAAVKNLLTDHGAVVADDAVDAVAADLAKTRGAALKRLTAAKDSVIQGLPGAVQTPQAIKAIDEQIARLSGINADKFAPVIRELESFKANLSSGKTLDQIEGNRRLLGDLFKAPELASVSGDGQKALNAIYGPLRSDMGNFIKANGGQAAFNKWKGANDQLAAMAGELGNKTFKSVLADAQATPENVAKMLFSKKPSDVARLYSNLSAEGRMKAQAAVLHKAMQDAGGFEAISPDRFANSIAKLGKTAGVHFEAPDLARLDGLSRVLEATKRASVAAAAPPTGVQNSLPIIGAVLADMFGSAGGAITGGAGVGLIARAYESAPVRNALLRLGRAPKGSPVEVAQLERAVVAISSAIKPYADKIAAAANENTMPALAADPGQEQQAEQQAPLQP